jgi:DNA repair protein RadC
MISGTLFERGDPPEGTLSITSQEEQAQRLREVLAAYHLDVEHLRELAGAGAELHEALRTGAAPPEVVHLITLLSALLRPPSREQITSPTMAAAMLMVEMGYLDQEQMRVMCLDTKNRLQKIHLVYQGSLNTSMIRIGELFKEPIRLNSAAIILAHNHPSGEPSPSPEDVLVTRQIIDAGELLDVTVPCQVK